MDKTKTLKGLENYRRLLQSAKKYWMLFVVGTGATMFVSLIDAFFAYLVKPIIDRGFVHHDMRFIAWLPLLIIVIFIFRGVAGFISDYFISKLSRGVVRDFRCQLFDHLLQLPARFYDRSKSGQLLSTIIYNVEQVAQASSTALITILRESTLLVGLIFVMLVVSWELFLLFILIVPLMIFVVRWSSRRLRRLSKTVQQSVGEVTHIAAETIGAYQVVRLFGGQQYEHDKFYRATFNNWRRELKVAITNSVGTSLVQMIIAVLIAVVLLFATLPTLQVTAGDFGTVVTAVIMLLRPAKQLTTVNSQIQKGLAGADSIFHLLDEETEKDLGTVACTRLQGDIVFDAVSFYYQADYKTVLNHISFHAKPGKTIAIVGHSGAGKSTLINLLPRFYELTAGSIRIDGVDVRDYQLQDLRHQFSLVSQHPVLFNDTVAHNIAYGLSGTATAAQIIAAAQSAYAWDFINELPNGLDTMIGENGVLLSGGQRQRIAIARALLKKAPILILDEATSALDTVSERQIQKALDSLMQSATTLVIAHRLSTVEHADWVLVLDKGHLREQGTHEMLIQQAGVYAELYRLQFKDPTGTTEVI